MKKEKRGDMDSLRTWMAVVDSIAASYRAFVLSRFRDFPIHEPLASYPSPVISS